MLPLWILVTAVYLHNVRGNTFIKDPVSAESSESSDRDTNSDLYILLGNADFEDDTRQFKDTRKDLTHILRSQYKEDTPKHLPHMLREKTDQEELDEKKKRHRLQIAQAKHMNRVTELLNFMKENVLSTEYFYSEMNRIKRQHKIKDSLRNMVDFLEKKPEIKRKVLKCYYDLLDFEPDRCQLLECKKPNTLVINDILPDS